MEKLYNISLPWKRHFVEAISLLFIILYTYAAVSKLLDFGNFQIQLSQSPFLAPFADWLLWAIPTVEIGIALLFFSSRFRLVALYASLVLMLLFTGYIIAVLNFADAVPCSCGGVIASLSWSQHLLFNLAFVLLAGLGIALYHRPGKPKERNQNIVSKSYKT